MSDEKKPQVAKPEPKKAAAPAAATTKREATIYIGPSLKGGRLARYTIFKGGVLTPNAAAIAAEHKSVSRLIVPVSKLAEYEQRLADRTSPEAALFVEAAKVFSEQGGK